MPLVWSGKQTHKSKNSHFIFSYDSQSGGEREIQRTMLELLNQLDGFDSQADVKVSTNGN